MKIGSRLTLSFVVVGLLMATGSVVAFWQLHRVQSEAQRLYQVDMKAQTVMRVHTNVLTFRQNLDRLLETQDIDLFEAEAAPRRQGFQNDVDRAIEAVGNSPLTGGRIRPPCRRCSRSASSFPRRRTRWSSSRGRESGARCAAVSTRR
jgi:hypothetical protein